MADAQAKTSRALWALLIGLAATAAVAGIHLVGLDRRAELLTLDFRFRHLSAAPDGNQLVHLDIDDTSLERLGRWPWPRAQLAGIIDVLEQAGARAVALDIILPEPQEVRFASDLWDVQRPEAARLLTLYPPLPVLDDLALAATLEKHGNVTVPMHIDPNAAEAVTDFEAGARRVLTTRPAASLAAVAEAMGAGTGQMERLRPAYLRARSLAALERFAYPAGTRQGFALRRGRIVPPLFLFAHGTHTTGFVTFAPDMDGTVRRIPLLLQAGRKVYPQFALALAAELISQRHGDLRTLAADAGGVRLTFADETVRRVPTDADGMMLINWESDAARYDPPKHIPALQAGEIWREQRKLDALDAREPLYRMQAVEAALAALPDNSDLETAYYDLAPQIQKWSAARRDRALCRLRLHYATLLEPDGGTLRGLSAEVDQATEQEALARRDLDAFARGLLAKLPQWLAALPASDAGRKNAEAHLRALAEDYPAEKDKMRRFIEKRLAALRPHIQGKLALIGSTATGAADFVPTPVAARLPGVVVHANIINTIASGAFVHQAPTAVDLAAIVLLGAVVSFLAARLPIVRAGVLSIAVLAGYVALNLLVVFALLDCWLALVTPLASALVGFLVVTAYRQMTEERAKRHIRGLFSHALSPVLVDQLLANPAQLQPTRRVLSCFFSDLASFTTMSDRLGELGTIGVLRRYFDRMTDIIQIRYGGYLSKFLGDGILGFFGAPVPQEDHARRALAAAMACQDETRSLSRELAAEFGEHANLYCRIGVSGGPVVFGDCGSSDRSDYTAIGPHVNLASRLETANKHFGTQVLVDEHVWRSGDDGSLLALPLGQVLVVGKPDPVRVWNVLGPLNDASDDLRTAAARFAEGIDRFARREFAAAAESFSQVLALVPRDRAAEMFLALCRQYLDDPPGEEWSGAVQLTEK